MLKIKELFMNRILVLFIAFCLSALSYGQNAETLRKANAGDAKAQYDIAETYLNGMYGAEKNDENQFEIAEKNLKNQLGIETKIEVKK